MTPSLTVSPARARPYNGDTTHRAVLMTPDEADRELARLQAAGALPPELVIGGVTYPARQATDRELSDFLNRIYDEHYRHTGTSTSKAAALNLLHTPGGVAVLLTIMYGVSREDADQFVQQQIDRVAGLLARAGETPSSVPDSRPSR